MAQGEGGGRPKKEINEKLIRDLASIQCTMNEIASITGVSVDTLERRFADIIKEAKDTGKASLRRQQWALAQKGNATMLVWMGKQILGQRDRHPDEVAPNITIQTDEKLSSQELIDLIKKARG